MIWSSLQPLTYAGLVAAAGLLMAISGLQKKKLRRREHPPRCPTCGRTDRYNCACRR
jgi:hypothetical protein